MKNQRIRHSVILKLKSGITEEHRTNFWKAVDELKTLPGIENFEVLKQISPKNKFEWCISMEFANQEIYDAYNIHPVHTAFVQNQWIPLVEDFLEIDYLLEDSR